jgi:hypothetical protein
MTQGLPLFSLEASENSAHSICLGPFLGLRPISIGFEARSADIYFDRQAILLLNAGIKNVILIRLE